MTEKVPSPLALIRPTVLALQAERASNPPKQSTPGGAFASIPYPDDVVAVIEAEWRAGLRPISEIASESGISRTLIYRWSVERNWPERAKVRAMAREAIDSKVIARAVDAFRAENPGRVAEVQDRLDALTAEGVSAGDTRTELVLEDYALVVAAVVEAQRGTATKVAGIGDKLVAIYDSTVTEIAAKYANDDIGKLKATQAFIATFATLVRAVSAAHDMQRSAYGLNAHMEGGGSMPGGGDGVSYQPGTYDDVVREAEARGERLS